METWNNQNGYGIEETQNFLESKKIVSFEAVKEFFKNVFLDFINKVDNSKAGIIEKKHEINFYIGDTSMSVIDQEDKITIWRMDSKVSKILAILDFEAGHAFVKYVNPVKIAYLCEEEIEKIYEQAFQNLAVIH